MPKSVTRVSFHRIHIDDRGIPPKRILMAYIDSSGESLVRGRSYSGPLVADSPRADIVCAKNPYYFEGFTWTHQLGLDTPREFSVQLSVIVNNRILGQFKNRVDVRVVQDQRVIQNVPATDPLIEFRLYLRSFYAFPCLARYHLAMLNGYLQPIVRVETEHEAYYAFSQYVHQVHPIGCPAILVASAEISGSFLGSFITRGDLYSHAGTSLVQRSFTLAERIFEHPGICVFRYEIFAPEPSCPYVEYRASSTWVPHTQFFTELSRFDIERFHSGFRIWSRMQSRQRSWKRHVDFLTDGAEAPPGVCFPQAARSSVKPGLALQGKSHELIIERPR